MSERIRWKLWGLVTRLPRVCPANAHTVIVSKYPDRSRNPFIDRQCRDLSNGSCYCGKLQRAERAAPDA